MTTVNETNKDGRIDPDTTTASVARSYLESFAGRDPDAIAAHVSADFVNEHTAALGQGCRGRDVYRERLPGFLADMVDLRYDIEHLVVENNTAAVFYTMTARWQGEAPISIRGVQRLVIDDGLIVHRVDYWDSAGFLAQASDEARAALAPFGIS